MSAIIEMKTSGSIRIVVRYTANVRPPSIKTLSSNFILPVGVVHGAGEETTGKSLPRALPQLF